jgi:hypothetical protein
LAYCFSIIVALGSACSVARGNENRSKKENTYTRKGMNKERTIYSQTKKNYSTRLGSTDYWTIILCVGSSSHFVLDTSPVRLWLWVVSDLFTIFVEKKWPTPSFDCLRNISQKRIFSKNREESKSDEYVFLNIFNIYCTTYLSNMDLPAWTIKDPSHLQM